MRVEHFMTKNPVTCDVDDTLEDVAGLMRDKGVGSVIVLENGKLRGLVTDRMIAVRGVAEGLDADTEVEDLLPDGREHPASVGVDDNIFAVIDTMRSGGVVRRLPVITPEGDVLGVVSISDVALIAKDLIDAVLLEETHNATKEAHILTGAKRFAKVMRRPTKAQQGRLMPDQPTRRVTRPTPRGPPGESGGAGRQPRRAAAAVSRRRGQRRTTKARTTRKRASVSRKRGARTTRKRATVSRKGGRRRGARTTRRR